MSKEKIELTDVISILKKIANYIDCGRINEARLLIEDYINEQQARKI